MFKTNLHFSPLMFGVMYIFNCNFSKCFVSVKCDLTLLILLTMKPIVRGGGGGVGEVNVHKNDKYNHKYVLKIYNLW